MKRFDDENDDFQEEDFFKDIDDDDDDEEDKMDPEEYAELLERRETLDLMQLDLVQLDLNQRLLIQTIRFLEKSFFWRFRRYKTKLKMIQETYLLMKSIIQEGRQEPEVEVKQQEN